MSLGGDMRPKFCNNFDLHKFLVNVAEVIKNYDPPKENHLSTTKAHC